MLPKQETLLGQGTRAESSREGEPRRTALPGAAGLGFMVMGGFASRLSFGQSF